jgi:hypothetical protein
MILLGAPLNEVQTTIPRLVEAHSAVMLCSIFQLDGDSLHLRYGIAASRQKPTGQRLMDCALVLVSDHAAQPLN